MSVHTFCRAAVAVTAVGVLSLFEIGTASATGKASAWYMGHEAARVNYWSSTDDFRLSDIACDGNSVYAQYQRAGASRQTLRNTKGCHTHADFNRSFTNGQSIKYRVCVKVALEPDNCSAWKWDTTG
ncbi:hypothetical protein ACFV47_14840 [Streptomyces solisilvae]|uniref:hypothetical protein n=1 Tax=Streptomyces malaysiensis TaxID=92644 RepID=UPI0036878BB6